MAKAKGIRVSSIAHGERVLKRLKDKLKYRESQVHILKKKIKQAKKSIAKQKKRRL